jgi:hypothetical protein
VLAPALLPPQVENGQGEQAADDATAMRAAAIGQAAAGLTAAVAIIYGAGALTIALRLYFTHLSWEAVLGQLPHDFILTTGFGEIILPAMIIGLLGSVLLNYLVNRPHGTAIMSRIQRGLQRYLTAPPSVGHFLVWLFTAALFGVLEPLVSLRFFNSHASTYFRPKVVIPAFRAMVTAAVFSAIAVGIALILLPAPTVDGLDHGLGKAAGQRRTVTQRVHEWPNVKRLREWSANESAEPAGSRQPGRVKKAARKIARGAVRRVFDPVLIENSGTSADLGFHAICRYSLISPASLVRRWMRVAGTGKAMTSRVSSGARSSMPSPWWLRPVL